MIRPENFNNLEEKLNYQLHNIKLFKLIKSFFFLQYYGVKHLLSKIALGSKTPKALCFFDKLVTFLCRIIR